MMFCAGYVCGVLTWPALLILWLLLVGELKRWR